MKNFVDSDFENVDAVKDCVDKMREAPRLETLGEIAEILDNILMNYNEGERMMIAGMLLDSVAADRGVSVGEVYKEIAAISLKIEDELGVYDRG